jgi:hypothetical protein
MLRLFERVGAERLHEFLPLLARDPPIAKRAESLEFGCELRFAIHGNVAG